MKINGKEKMECLKTIRSPISFIIFMYLYKKSPFFKFNENFTIIVIKSVIISIFKEKRNMKTIAILGATASGKTSLSIRLAKEYNANILSLDSLSIYKEIDIASAKPSLLEREGVKHFGIDEILPNENFNVSVFLKFFNEAKKTSLKENKNLIIVGGTGFYLKSLIFGLSQRPVISEEIKIKVTTILQNIDKAYSIIQKNDESYAQKISHNDSYRIEKWLEIFLQSGKTASEYFKENRQKPVLEDITLFEIDTSKDMLRERIALRTKDMLKKGLIDEVVYLEKNYTRKPNSMRSIGIKETLEFLDGFINKNELIEKIIISTAQLAKRQRTFNSTQFAPHVKDSIENIYINASKILTT